MKTLVTGGTGFIGKSLVKALIEKGHQVIVTGGEPESTPEGATFLPTHLIGIDWRKLQDVNIVFHQAALNDTTYLDRSQMMMANLDAAVVLFERTYNLGCKRYVFASSTAVYGDSQAPYIESVTPLNPLNPYAESKVRFEEFALEFSKRPNTNVVGLRYCNVYGPGEDHKGHRMSMIGQIIRRMRGGEPPVLFKHGEQRRDWIHVDDVVTANLAASEFDGSGIFNCGSGASATFNEIVDWSNEALGTSLGPTYIDNPYEERYQSHTECSMKLCRANLKFEPKYNIQAGVTAYARVLQ